MSLSSAELPNLWLVANAITAAKNKVNIENEPITPMLSGLILAVCIQQLNAVKAEAGNSLTPAEIAFISGLTAEINATKLYYQEKMPHVKVEWVI